MKAVAIFIGLIGAYLFASGLSGLVKGPHTVLNVIFSILIFLLGIYDMVWSVKRYNSLKGK